MSAPLRRLLAHRLLRGATRLLPSARADWARAMHAEFNRCEGDRDALEWAFGCLVASFKERVNIMLVGNLKISRWVLAPELLLCFVPLTIACLDVMESKSGILRLNMAIIRRSFIGTPEGEIELAAIAAGAIVSLLGPIGLVAAFRLIVLGRPMQHPWLRRTLVIGPIVCGALTVSAHLALRGLSAFSLQSVDAFDFWSGLFLLSALPALGAAHMFRLAPPNAQFTTS